LEINLDSVVDILARHNLLDLDSRGPSDGWPDPEDYDLYEPDWRELGRNFDSDRQSIPTEVPDGWADRGGFEAPDPDDVDADAWYQPIHFFGRRAGIYIKQDAILRVAGAILVRLPGYRAGNPLVQEAARKAALFAYYFHEAFHHKAESAAMKFEMVTHQRRYVPYWDNVFVPQRSAGSLLLTEEGLANADMIRRFREATYAKALPPDVIEATINFLTWCIPQATQPYYAIGVKYVENTMHAMKQAELLSQIEECVPSPIRDPDEWDLFPRAIQGLFDCRRVTYTLVPKGTPPLPWLKRIDPAELRRRGFRRV